MTIDKLHSHLVIREETVLYQAYFVTSLTETSPVSEFEYVTISLQTDGQVDA